MGLRERGEMENREGRRRAKIKKQNGRESLGFFRLKLKLKWCVSHPFFLLEFWLVLASIQPKSPYVSSFGQYDPIRPELGNEKKMQHGTNTQAAVLPAAHYVKHRCSTPVVASVL